MGKQNFSDDFKRDAVHPSGVSETLCTRLSPCG